MVIEMNCEKTTQTYHPKRGDSRREKLSNISQAFDTFRHVLKGSDSNSQIQPYSEIEQCRTQQLNLDIWQNWTIENIRNRMI